MDAPPVFFQPLARAYAAHAITQQGSPACPTAKFFEFYCRGAPSLALRSLRIHRCHARLV